MRKTRVYDIERQVIEEMTSSPAAWRDSAGVALANEINQTSNAVIDTQVELFRRVANTGLTGPAQVELYKTFIAAGAAGRMVIMAIGERAYEAPARDWQPGSYYLNG